MNKNCACCNGMTDDERFDRIAHNITAYGLHIAGVEGGPVPWAHTIGLAEVGLPELIITDVPFDIAAGVLNVIGQDSHQRLPIDECLEMLDCSLGEVYPSHLADTELLSAWFEYYWNPRVVSPPARFSFKQVLPGATYFCRCHASLLTDLSRPEHHIFADDDAA